MRSKGSRFTLGVWGLRVCSLDVAQPSATVRNRPRDPHMAVPMVSSAKGVTFGGLTYSVASFRVAGVALRDIQTCRVAYFFANRIVRAASSGDKVEIPWQAWHFVRCAENLRNPCTKHQF